ncbi:hypothetical protein Tco_0958590 [Tanacetum coccineum]
MKLYTKLSERVLALETIKTNQALEIDSLKRRVKKLEKKKGSRTHRLGRLYKVGRSARVVSSKDKGLGAQEDAFKQGRKIDEIDQDAEVTLVDETQERYGDNLIFDTGVLDNEQDMAKKEVDMAEKDVSTADPVTTAGEVVTTANVEVTTASATTTTVDAELEEEERLAREEAKKLEQANIASWDNVQAMIDVDYQMAKQLQVEEQEQLSIEEKSKFEAKKESSSKRAGEELESENLKKQKLDENVEAEVDDDQEEAEMKKHMEIVPDDEVAIDAIPLATKPPIIMLQNIDRDDMETLWKLVKAKHELTRPEEAYERVIWGDLKVMFEPDLESEVWRNLQGYKVTV